MKVVGITGGIASGKSTLSAYLKDRYKAYIFNADEEAKKLLNDDIVKDKIKEKFPNISNFKDKLEILGNVSFILPLTISSLSSFFASSSALKIYALYLSFKYADSVLLPDAIPPVIPTTFIIEYALKFSL